MIKFLFLSLLFSQTIFAQDKIQDRFDKILSQKQINIGYRKSAIPLSYSSEGEPSGFSVDICKMIINKIDKDIKISWIEINESQKRFDFIDEKKIDIECGNTSITAEREKKYLFSNPFYVAGIKFLSHKKHNIQSLSQLKGKKILVTKNTTSHDLLKNLLKEFDFELIAMPTHIETLEALEKNLGDAWCMDDVILASYKILSKDRQNWIISTEPVRIEPYALLLNKNNPKLLYAVNNSIKDIYKENKWDILYKRWFQTNIKIDKNKSINLNLAPQKHIQKLLNKD